MFLLVLVFMLVVVSDVGRGVRVFATSVTSYHVVIMSSRWTSISSKKILLIVEGFSFFCKDLVLFF